MNLIQQSTKAFDAGRDLDGGEAKALFIAILDSRDPVEIGNLLEAWSDKGVSAAELQECAGLMRANAVRVESKQEGLLDIVGTGGSPSKLFNVSTAAALVAAGATVPVAKHGNRAASSKTGSADALSTLGVDLSAEPEEAGRILDLIGICFMFAPKFHNLTAELASARKNLGRPTIFNQLGPLANPALASFQIIGVWNPQIMNSMSAAVSQLGSKKTWIVHGSDGLDEITLAGPTRVHEIRGTKVRQFELSPADFGLTKKPLSGFSSMTPAESAATIRSVLENRADSAIAIEIVALNAAAAIYVAGRSQTYAEATEKAFESIRTGAAAEKLAGLVRESRI